MATQPTDDLNQGFSLADLADIDVSDIEEIRFVTLPAGVYDWEVTAADLSEDEKDGERRFKAEYELTVRDVHAVLEPGIDKDTLLNKRHTERFFVKPGEEQTKVLESIGRIRAFTTDIGLESAGKLGDIVRNSKGHIFKAATRRQKPKDDPSHPGYTRLVLDQKKK